MRAASTMPRRARLISILLAPFRLHALALGLCGLGGLILSVMLLPIDWDSPSQTGRALYCWMYGPMSADVNCGSPPVCRIAKVDGRWIVASVHDQTLASVPSLYTVRPRVWRARAGLFAITRVETDASLPILDSNYDLVDLAPDDAVAIRTATVDAIQQCFPGAYANVYSITRNAVASGRWLDVQAQWLGWLHNAMALISLAALCTALFRARVWLHRRWRTASGGCAWCGYSTAGLPIAACCPECGRHSDTY
ncbi:MAG: hypothetical protein QM783_20185 [Phycisphaerales bacterium]